MGKILRTKEGCSVKRVSRKIRIKEKMVTESHRLFPYADKETLCLENNRQKASLSYFTYKGRDYAVNQFVALGSAICPQTYTYLEHNIENSLHAVDMAPPTVFGPYLLLELMDGGEAVRLYQEVKKGTGGIYI